MSRNCILILESDVVIRTALADYLRECGYRVFEAIDTGEARRLLDDGAKSIDIVLIDADATGAGGGFGLAAWVRTEHPRTDIILAGTVATAAEKAGALCEDGPMMSKPYDHKLLLDRIRRSLAVRDRNT